MNTTIVMPVSRDTHLSQVFHALENLDCRRKETNLLVYVDGDLKLYEKARNFTVNSKFEQRLCIFRKNASRVDASNVLRRRQRIADIHNEIKEYIDKCEYIFLTEDDTILPPNALRNLHADHIAYPHAGFISGMQLGRWGFLHLGVWRVKNIYEPSEIYSIKLPKHTQEVDAAGIYCMLTRRELYMQHEFKPFEKILGPDFDFGLELRRQGYKNYVVPIRCAHLTPKEKIQFHNSQLVQVRFRKDEVSHTGWIMSNEEIE